MTDQSASEPIGDDAALRAIVEGVEAETGERFFSSLVRHLAAALRVQYAFVSELVEEGTCFRTRALWGRGALLANLRVPLFGTPCESVLHGEAAHYPDRLQQRFPEDKGLETWRAESYCGVPLLDSSGIVCGHLAIIDDEPMPDGPRGLSILRIFAARARAEIERLRVEGALRESEDRLARILDSAMDAIVTFDGNGRVELFNDSAEKVFGCRASEAIGRPIDRFLSRSLDAAVRESMRTLASGDLASRYLWSPEGLAARRGDGETFPIEATLSHVEVGARQLYTLILRDIEDRRRAEEELGRLHRQNEYLQQEIREVHNVGDVVGESRAFRAVLDEVALVAATDSSVLILGETGTGKEVVARVLHSSSRRKSGPLIKVNCAALPGGLVESELFGHEKGAFTGATDRRVGRFELAHGGTIFLDEVGEIPPDVQVKLLRVLQERQFERVGGSKTIDVDVRVIAATNRDLAAAVEEGKFRQDLYYRLNVFPIRLPPLRERREDIAPLVHYFTARSAARAGRPITRVPGRVMEQLLAYPWPGNVRELENVIERGVILSEGPDLQLAPAIVSPLPGTPSPTPPVAAAPDPTDGRSLEALQRSHIIDVLKKTQWRIDGPAGAARLLQMNPSTLRSRMKRLGIRRSGEIS